MSDALAQGRSNLPAPARVRAGAGGVPLQVDGRAIEPVRESWLVEDRWWTARAAAAPLLGAGDARAGATWSSSTTWAESERTGGWFAQGA